MADNSKQDMTPIENIKKCGISKGDHDCKAKSYLNDDKIFGIEKTYLVIFLVSFCQGIQGLSDLAVSYLYKDDLKLQPYELAKISGIASIPWIIKPVYGFISDSFPIFGYRRKPYLFIFGLMVSLSWLLMSIYVSSINQAIIVTLICSISTAFCNVIGEALVVELSQRQSSNDHNAGAKNVSMFFMTKSIGSLVTAFSSGALLEYMDKRKIFLITSIFPLLIVLSSIVLNENRIKSSNQKSAENKDNFDIEKTEYDQLNKEYENIGQVRSSNIIVCEYDNHNLNKNFKNNSLQNKTNENLNHNEENDDLSLKHQLSLFWSFLKTDKIYKPVIFIFLFMITPSYSDAMFYFYTNVLNFNAITIGRLRLIYGIATILGIYLYNNFLKETSFKKIIFVSTILSSFFNMLSLVLVERINLRWGIPDYMFCLATDALTTALSEINFLPILVLACNICPKNIEGTLYAFLMSIVNLSGLFSNQMGAGITYMLGITSTNFSNLKYLIIISNISMLLPMAFLYMINDQDYIKKSETNNIDKDENQKLVQKKSFLNRSNSFKNANNKKEDNFNLFQESGRLTHNRNNDDFIKKFRENSIEKVDEDEKIDC